AWTAGDFRLEHGCLRSTWASPCRSKRGEPDDYCNRWARALQRSTITSRVASNGQTGRGRLGCELVGGNDRGVEEELIVTEADWLASTDPEKMLAFLQGKASERKFRYFLVACARRVLPVYPDEDMIEALAVAERFADGMESRHRLAQIRSSLKTHHS